MILCLVVMLGRPGGAQSTTCTSSSGTPSTWTLQNPASSYTLASTGGNIWLKNGHLTPSRAVQFLETDAWSIQLRRPPGGGFPVDVRPALSSIPGGLAISLGPICQSISGEQQIVTEWEGFVLGTEGGDIEDEGVPGPSDDEVDLLRLRVRTFWALNDGRNYLATALNYEIQNAAQNEYRVWNIRYPRILIENLDPPVGSYGGGADYLATGESGGRLFGNPILFKDPYSTPAFKPMAFCGNPDRPTGKLDLHSLEPEFFVVPVVCYYHTAFAGQGPLGVYLSNTDDQGFLKGLHIVPQSDPLPGALLYEVMSHPSSDEDGVFEIEQFDPDLDLGLRHHVGVIEGDWVDAAKKYKDWRINNTVSKFPWLHGTGVQPRPSGHPDNPAISPELKSNPIQISIGSKNSIYCPGDMQVGASVATCSSPPLNPTGPVTIAKLYDWVQTRFGNAPVGYLAFPRTQLAYDEVVWPFGYVQDGKTAMNEVRALVGHAINCGHRLLFDSPTEAFWQNDQESTICVEYNNRPDCFDFDGHLYNYCCVLHSGWRALAWPSALINLSPHDDGVAPDNGSYSVFVSDPCPAGRTVAVCDPAPASCPVSVDTVPRPTWCTSEPSFLPAGVYSWKTAFANLVAGAIMGTTPNVNGGLRLNRPTVNGQACFSNEHDHQPGFGAWGYGKWKELIEHIRTAAAVPEDFFTVIEYGTSVISEYCRVQNPLSCDIITDPLNMTATPSNAYFDAPIHSIPMMQMVADEVRYCTQYTMGTLSLPFNTVSGTSFLAPFDCATSAPNQFPAISAAFNCYSQARRTLAHQASILIDTTDMVDFALFVPPKDNNNKRAAQDMVAFYEGMRRFLTASGTGGRNNMGYFTGSMERQIPLELDLPLDAEEEFAIPLTTIEAVFPNLDGLLHAGGTANPYLDDELHFDLYRPPHEPIFVLNRNRFQATTVPDERESWLPHGVYRHWDDDESPVKINIALLVANPWGVSGQYSTGTGTVSRPMNPFNFDFQSPQNSATANSYTYTFTFDPAKYGIAGNYKVVRKTWNIDATQTSTFTYQGPCGNGTYCGPQDFTTTLQQFKFQAFYFDEQ